MKFSILCVLMAMMSSVSAQVVYKDTGLPPDTCPVKSVLQGTVIDVMSKLGADASKHIEEPNVEGCLTLKSIYINNLISSLEYDPDQNFCDQKNNCKKASEIVAKDYANLVAYLQKTQKADVLSALKNDRNNIGSLIINQVQNLAATRYRDDSVYDMKMLAKVNANIQRAFNLDLNLRPKMVDVEKTKTCTDYSIICPMQMSDPARATDYCKNLMKQSYPQYCTAGAAAGATQAAMVAASPTPSLTDAQAEEYLNLNLDVKKAFETKSAKDTRGKTQFASDHYRDFAEAEGRPVSVKEYLNCNPDVAYAFNDPAMNTNQDEAKTNIVAFVAKHFQYLIQPIVPVSSRNFKTHGCIDVEKYLTCHEDVKKHCSSVANGDRDFVNQMKICAMNHYKASGQKEGRTDSCSK